MDWKVMLASFAIVFVAELGDKTQLAALALTGRTANPLAVFVGASVALVIVTAIGVGAGALLGKLMSERAMEFVSAILFLGVGGFLLVRAMFFHESA